MHLMDFDPTFFLPFLIFSIPIIAIVGGITAGIIKSVGRQRLVEMAQRERIAAIERGIDPSKLPPLPALGDSDDGLYVSRNEHDRRLRQGLLIGGVITTGVGMGLMVFLWTLIGADEGVWAVGAIPLFVGVALLLSSWLVRPKNGTSGAQAD